MKFSRDDLRELRAVIGAGKSPIVVRQSLARTVRRWDRAEGVTLYFVWDKTRSEVVTFLTEEMATTLAAEMAAAEREDYDGKHKTDL